MSDTPVVNNKQAVSEEFIRTHPWVRQYEKDVPYQIDVPDHPLTWLLDTTANRAPGRTAMIYYGNKISYAQLSSLAYRFAIALKQLGIQKGDRVAIALPNIPQYPIAFYGALRAGAVAVPTNPLYTERELEHQLKDSGARVLIMLDMFYPIIREGRKNTPVEHIIITSPADFLPPILRPFYPLKQRREKTPQPALTKEELSADPSMHLMKDLLKAHSTGEIEQYNLPVPTSSDDLAALQYTGGTTGLSKGAMLTHRNLLANTMQVRSWEPGATFGTDNGLCVAPFFHSYGMTVCMNLAIYMAGTMILLPRFNPKDTLKAIKRYHTTHFPGIPTMYIAVMKEAKGQPDALRSLEVCISGAAPLPAQVRTDFEKLITGKIVEGYGLSEASPVTHCNPLSGGRDGSIGLPFPGVEAAIMNPETHELLPPGEVGEIVVKGPNIMKGYWNREEETKAIFVNGWMRTGDVGKMDKDGFFYVVDRSKDMILASGFNVYPREIEEILFQYPAVAEAAVIGVPHEYRGETVAAFVVLKPDFAPTDETREKILAFCKEQLTPYKVPKILEFRDSLPTSLVGKVLRRELRAEVASKQQAKR